MRLGGKDQLTLPSRRRYREHQKLKKDFESQCDSIAFGFKFNYFRLSTCFNKRLQFEKVFQVKILHNSEFCRFDLLGDILVWSALRNSLKAPFSGGWALSTSRPSIHEQKGWAHLLHEAQLKISSRKLLASVIIIISMEKGSPLAFMEWLFSRHHLDYVASNGWEWKCC